MPKKLLYLEIDPSGTITRQINPVAFELDPKWQATFDKGAELVHVTVPAPQDGKQSKKVKKAIDRCVIDRKRYALEPVPGTDNEFVGVYDPGVIMLKLDRKGRVHDQKRDALLRGEYLASPYSTRMIAGRMYPEAQIALVEVPTRMTEEDRLTVANAMRNICYEGKRYKLIGATGGAKEGKFYFVEEKWEEAFATHYQHWPETAISYFGVMVSECEKGLIELDNVRIRIVEDHELGTNDCRGWIVDSIWDKLGLADNVVLQHRIGFRGQKTQGKGLAKRMTSEVANHPSVDADIILPESSIKPSRPDLTGKTFVDNIVLGIREVSRCDTKTKGSYTVLQHASWEVIESEIIAQCMSEIELLRSGFNTEEHEELLELIGAANQDQGFYRVPIACLYADKGGWMVQHPYIHNMLKQALAKWAYKMLTGGGMRMPGRTLIDDGYLDVDNGDLVQGSDWIPYDTCITDQPGDRNLCVRFPVRMIEDLLPMKRLYRDAAEAQTANSSSTGEQAVEMLMTRGLSQAAAERVFDTQLNLYGTYTLHCERAKTFGGDYDGDNVAIINSVQYPKFVEYRFGVVERTQPAKDKKKRQRSPWFNIYSLAFSAMGNRVGRITNVMSSALAAGQDDLSYECVPQLQLEIDSLKHNTQADMRIINKIAEKVGKPKWLDIDKKLHSVDELPDFIQPLSASDKVANMYNLLIERLREVIGDANQINSYAGLFFGRYSGKVTSGMLQECRTMRSFYGGSQVRLSLWLDRVANVVKVAQSKMKECKNDPDAKERAFATLQKAEADYEGAKRKYRTATRKVREDVCAWGAGKNRSEQMLWAAALNTVVTSSRAGSGGGQEEESKTGKRRSSGPTGSILAHAFPQQLADVVAAVSGSEPVLVDTWVGNWTIEWDKERDKIVQVNNDGTRIDRYEQKTVQETGRDGEIRTVRQWRRSSPTDILAEAMDADEDSEDSPIYSNQ